MVGPSFEYRKPKVTRGQLRVPVTFFGEDDTDTPEPNHTGKTELFSCLCYPYASSAKDLSILEATGAKRGVTIVIPDTRGEFIITPAMTAVLSDPRYQLEDGSYIEWNIHEPREDFENNQFVTIVLGVAQ